MKHLFALALCFFLSINLFSQTINVDLGQTSAFCSGSTKTIKYLAYGFNQNTPFSFLISNSLGQFSSASDTLAKSTILIANQWTYQNINVIIPASVNTYSSNYKIKAVWQGAESSLWNVTINTNANTIATLSGSYFRIACNNSPVAIPYTVSGQGPVVINYRDSLRNNIAQIYSNYSPNVFSFYSYDNSSNTLTFLNSTNACGVGIASGKANVSISYPVLTIGQASDTVICAGEKIRIPYTNSNINCPVSFQLSDANGNNFKTVSPDTYIPPNNYDFVIPENTVSGNYKVRIVNYAKNTYPVPSDSIVGQFTLKIKARPKITVSNQNTLNVLLADGSTVPIQFSLTGTPPFNFYFDAKRYYAESSTLTIPFEVKKTQQLEYGNVIDASGCYDPNSATFNVYTEIYPKITALPAETPVGFVSNYKFRNYCRGQQMRVDYKIAGNLPPNTVLKAQIRKIYVTGWVDVNTIAGYEPQQLLVEIPANIEGGNYEIRILPQNTALKVLYGIEVQPGFIYNSNIFTVIEPLKVNFIGITDSISIRKREAINLLVQVRGGAEIYSSTYLGKPPYSISIKNSQNNRIYTVSNENYQNGFGTFQIYMDTLTRATTFEILSATSPIECPNTQYLNKFKVNVDASVRNIKISSDGTSTWYQPNSYICGGTTLTVPIWKSGTFNPDNHIKIFLSEYNSKYEFFEVPAIDNGNNTITFALPNSTKVQSYNIRAEATSPKTIGAIGGSTIYVGKQTPRVNLSGEFSVIAGSLVEFKASFGILNIAQNIVFTDGTNDYSFYVNASTTPFEQIFKITIPANTSAGIKYITTKSFSNSCGQANLTGSVQINVLSTAPMLISNPSNLCFSQPENGYSPTYDFNSNLIFGQNNKFKARIFLKNIPSSPPVEYNAVLENGKISFSYSSVTYNDASLADVQMVSSDPYVVSNFLPFSNATSPSVRLTAPSQVLKGSSVNITYTLTGVPPFKITVLEGEDLVVYTSNSTTMTVSKVMDNTRLFRVIGIEDATSCKGEYNQNTYGYSFSRQLVEVIQVAKPIKINKVNKTVFCQNDLIEISIIKNKIYSNYFIQISEIGKNNFIDIIANYNAEKVSALLPTTLKTNTKYEFRVKTVGVNTDVSYLYPYAILISATPSATIAGDATIIKNENQSAPLTFQMKGVPPYQINYSDGTDSYNFLTYDSLYTLKVQPSVSKTYFISSVKNACSYGVTNGTSNINVLSIKTNHLVGLDGICYGQTLIVPFSSEGNFNANNQFKIQLRKIDLSSNTQTGNYFTLDATVNGNALYATLPASMPFSSLDNKPYNIRVISTSPAVIGDYALNLTNISNHNIFVWGIEPVISLSANPSISPGESLDINVNANGYSNFWYFKLTDGQSNFYYYPTSFPYKITLNPTQNTVYTLNQFYSACGGIIGSPSSVSVIIDPCPQSKMITSTILNGNKHFEARDTIEAINLIKTGANVQYNAGNYLIFSSGFMAEANSVFKAQVKGCNN